MIKVDGVNVEVEGSFDDVMQEYLFLTDAISKNASNQLGIDRDEWLKKVFDVVSSDMLEEDN